MVLCLTRVDFNRVKKIVDFARAVMNDYHSFKNTSGGSDGGSGGSGGGFGCGWIVIVIVVIMLISFIASGSSWEAVDTLLGLGFLAFLLAISLFK